MQDLTPLKKFGQNFLIDSNIINKIIAAFDPKPDDLVLEIGPGKGAISEKLLNLLEKLYAVEFDLRAKEYLATKFDFKKLEVFNENILKFDLGNFIQDQNKTKHKKLRIIGNLPYNISTEIIFHVLASSESLEDLLFMLQKEVVARIAASPNTKEYGKLSVMVQYFCHVEKLFTIPPNAFYPAPKVTSQMVYLKPYNQGFKSPHIVAKDPVKLKQIVFAAFGQRRKTLANSLKGYISSESLQKLEIKPNLRAENLSVNDFVKISNLLI